MRKRNNDVHIMLSDTEYAQFMELLNRTDMNYREFILNAVSGNSFITTEYAQELSKLNELLGKIHGELNKIGVNINQLAKVANSAGNPADIEVLNNIYAKIDIMAKGVERVWAYTRQFLVTAGKARIPTER